RRLSTQGNLFTELGNLKKRSKAPEATIKRSYPVSWILFSAG
ncbi:hypothetical protein MUK42_32412, partial [Musa troglodytarum]